METDIVSTNCRDIEVDSQTVREIVSREVCGLCRAKLHHAPTKDQMCRNVSRETILISADQIWFTFVRVVIRRHWTKSEIDSFPPDRSSMYFRILIGCINTINRVKHRDKIGTNTYQEKSKERFFFVRRNLGEKD